MHNDSAPTFRGKVRLLGIDANGDAMTGIWAGEADVADDGSWIIEVVEWHPVRPSDTQPA